MYEVGILLNINLAYRGKVILYFNLKRISNSRWDVDAKNNFTDLINLKSFWFGDLRLKETRVIERDGFIKF